MIKKNIILFVILAVGVLSLAACSFRKQTAAVTESAVTAENTEEEIETPESTAAAAAVKGEEKSAKVLAEDAPLMQKADVKAGIEAFAERIQEAVSDKDLEALADLTAFPVYVKMTDGSGREIGSKEEFLALTPADVFTDALVNAVATIDTASLEVLDAGVVLGDGTPNITFKVSPDGQKMGITGINQ